MLSRIAESLFWLGRYVERADDTARILDAYLHRLLEDPGATRTPPAVRCTRSSASSSGRTSPARWTRCWPGWPSTPSAPAPSRAPSRRPGRTR
ncbi:alpha-E domain-containing protein [Streptacidiphilus monticola]